jgi:TPR repeat protein
MVTCFTTLSPDGFAWSATRKSPRAQEQAPSLYFWNHERSQNEKHFETVDAYIYDTQERVRRVVPVKTANAYSAAQLREWARRGDLIANFIIAGQLRGSLSAQTINSQQNDAALARSIPFYKQAARPSDCVGIPASNMDARKFFGCDSGLPEAQYVLAICYKYGLSGCRQDDGISEKYCSISKSQGYIPAENLCGSGD